MALIRADIFSVSLMRNITIHAVIPSDKITDPTKGIERKTFKTLYLLNGMMGNDFDWVTATRIERWAKDRDLAVIMPAGENRFYVDLEIPGQKYSTFVGKELVEQTRALFPLSDKREDTFIAGLSMGGYGATVNGLRFSETFSHIAALSAAYVLDRVDDAVYNAPWIGEDRAYLEHVFGNLSQLRGSEKDYEALILKLKEEKKDIPKIYMAIGVDDDLLDVNRKYHEFLQEQGVAVDYVEAPGAHEWDFWDSQIKKVLDWLPLGEVNQGLSSGNITVD